MKESFDRIVRDFDELGRYRDYIARNPEKANLRTGEFILSTRETLQPARNTDLQSVRPAELHSTEPEAPDRMSVGRTGRTACVPDSHEKLVAYLSDCSAVPNAIVDLISGVKVLIIDALRDRPHPTHLSVGQALEVAARVKPEATFFTHICHDLPQSAESRLAKGAHIAYDGLKLRL
jgi:ribonuclease BN (tRNA processing enzyme)